MPVVSVSQVNNHIRHYIEQNKQLSDIWVKGEISNFKRHYSGHIYLTLKDESSVLKAVMFKSSAAGLMFDPVDGTKVIALGKISVYEPSGVYQLYIQTMISDGKGELYAAYEKLKVNLENEGLFDADFKKPIPRFPEKIGVITSISGAAIRDILNVLKRRYPLADITIYPVKVQGIGASESICKGLEYFSSSGKYDVVILGRGGGSIEDLWAFNEEKTVRAIFNCTIPVISGVGHETDYTLCDFVADKRAPTPSAAAELCVPSSTDISLHLNNMKTHLSAIIRKQFEFYYSELEKNNVNRVSVALRALIKNYNLHMSSAVKLCRDCLRKKLDKSTFLITQAHTSIESMNPLAVLKRGYAIPLNDDGKRVDICSLSEGQPIKFKFYGGNLECVIRRIDYEE